MKIDRKKFVQLVGLAGTITAIFLFVRSPSFPTPDKLFVFLVFVFMMFNEAWSMTKRILPFIALLLVYESFRGIADELNTHVNYTLAADADRFIFGGLPTVYLQDLLWRGHIQWYDFVFYLPYMLFFVLPLGLAILVWKTRDKHYWRVVTSYLVVFFAAFLTFFLFPAAPPWLAAENHYIEPITRVSSHVWQALGISDFPSLYNKIAPNPVAAVPSLHAACATLFGLFIFKLYGRRWGLLSLIYPLLIYIGVTYQGEHYAFDVILGITYGIAAYIITPYLMKAGRRASKLIVSRVRPGAPKTVQ